MWERQEVRRRTNRGWAESFAAKLSAVWRKWFDYKGVARAWRLPICEFLGQGPLTGAFTHANFWSLTLWRQNVCVTLSTLLGALGTAGLGKDTAYGKPGPGARSRVDVTQEMKPGCRSSYFSREFFCLRPRGQHGD